MARFSRKCQPPALNNSRQYKPFLRTDFQARCAYCERPEEYLGGEEAFEVEHFRPKSKFPELDCIYTNLYYACRGCNGHKSETWPSVEQLARGMQFADPCVADPYIQHLVEGVDGSVTGTTPSGIYTAAHIRLHRESLKQWRRRRAQAASDLPIFGAILGYLEKLRSMDRISDGEELEGQIAALRRYIEDAKRRFRIG